MLHNIIKTDVRVFLCIGLFVVSAYSFMLASPFKTLDDEFSIVSNPEIRDLGNIPGFFTSTYFKEAKDYYRPLVYVTYALEYHFFGLQSFYYNLDNVILHVLNAFLVFLLAGLLLRDRVKGFFVALLFAVHPIHWEAVDNISGRAILLCAFFTLGGYIFFLKFVRERKIGFLVWATIAYALGLLCKESAGVLIFSAMAYWFLVEKKTLREGLVFWPFFLVAGGYALIRHALGIVQMFPWPSWQEMGLGIVSFLNGLLVYVRLFLLPTGLHFDRGHWVYKSLAEPGFWVTLAVFGILGYLFFRFRRRMEALTIFCGVWFLVELFPVSQIVTTIGVYPGAISLAEHFVYVASVPVFILMVRGAANFSRTWEKVWGYSRVTIRMACAGFLIFLFLILIRQNIYASSEVLMLKDSLREDPKNVRLQYSLGMVYAKAGDFSGAVRHLRRASEDQEGNHIYRIALGKALVDSGDVLAGVREYEKVMPRPQNARLLEENKKAAYGLLVRAYEKKVQEGNISAGDLFALGVFYSKSGDRSRAREAFERSWCQDARRFDSLFNVAVISEEMNDWSRSRAAYEELASREDPANAFRRAAQDRLMDGVFMAGQGKKTSAQ